MFIFIGGGRRIRGMQSHVGSVSACDGFVLKKNGSWERNMRTFLLGLVAALLTLLPGVCCADFTGTQKFIVLRVQAHDSTGTTYTTAQVQQQFDNITTLWGPHSSYGKITPVFLPDHRALHPAE
jgi:hypothetical protein